MKSRRFHFVIAIITFTIGITIVTAWLSISHLSVGKVDSTNLAFPASTKYESSKVSPEQENSLTSPSFASELNFISKSKKKQAANFYSIEATYPQLIDLNVKNAQKFNELIEQLVSKEMVDYERDEKQAIKKNKGAPVSSAEYLEISYQIIFSTSKIISIKLIGSVMSVPQFHPIDYYISINYDLEFGKLLELSDLFKARANYLGALSNYCLKKLEKDYWPADWLMREGTAPNLKNFKNWNITPIGILISFEDYQVGVNAMGAPEIIVPYSILKRLIAKKSIENSLIED